MSLRLLFVMLVGLGCLGSCVGEALQTRLEAARSQQDTALSYVDRTTR